MWTNLSWVGVTKADTRGSITATSLQQAQRPRSPRLDEARVLHEISMKAREDRRPEQARRFARRALAILERDHADGREMAKVLISLAAAYRDEGDCARDRKSTRLNSSHLVISYAVFCLKKKKHK